jgi:hypothetical protein
VTIFSSKRLKFENVLFPGEVKGFFEALTKEINILGIKTKKFKIQEFSFRLGEKSAIRYPVVNRKINDYWFLKDFKIHNPLLYNLWNWSSKCGQSLTRWTLWSLLIVSIFAFIYHNLFYLSDSSLFKAIYIDETWPALSFIYYSVVTFTTLGFGDIVPNSGWLQFWVMIEVIIGYIMLGGLISIFATKLARRS